jgi:hypothetical protein
LIDGSFADRMLYTFALPTKADKVPAGPDRMHEVKYDGYLIPVHHCHVS